MFVRKVQQGEHIGIENDTRGKRTLEPSATFGDAFILKVLVHGGFDDAAWSKLCSLCVFESSTAHERLTVSP